MTPAVAGIDVGGTKTHVRISADGVLLHEIVVSSQGWSATPAADAAAWLIAQLAVQPHQFEALAVGAQGCEAPEHCTAIRHELEQRLHLPVTVVNDAELLLPAAGLNQGIAVVVGTGSIALHDNGAGEVTRAGGWGWVLGDDGSASALVREAAKAVLAHADRGGQLTPLGKGLMEAAGVTQLADLAHALSWGNAPESWGIHAPVVVAAADLGSPDARQVLTEGARAIVALVETLAQRGLPADDVVFAGGLVTNVSSYWLAIQESLAKAIPTARPHLLTVPPVTGAVRLAAQIVRR